MKPKHQRLTLIILAVVAVLGAILLAMPALRSEAAYFYAPADVQSAGVPVGRTVRVGGMVEKGSIRRDEDGVSIRFNLGDESENKIKVVYRGITPDLFREESGAVAEGSFDIKGLFHAEEILAKHDETYRPPVAISGTGVHKTDSLQ